MDTRHDLHLYQLSGLNSFGFNWVPVKWNELAKRNTREMYNHRAMLKLAL